LKVDSATGFESLTRVSGRGVTIVRSDMTLRANRVDATNWNKLSGVINATGNVRATSAKGSATAGSATFQNEKINAKGGVIISSDGNTIRGASGQTDLKFQNATLNGGVRAELRDGSTLRANSVVKTGDKIVAVGGATGSFKTKGELGALQFTAPRLESDAGGQNAIATGGVTIKSATGATAKASSAVYDRVKSKVTATGGVVFNDPARGLSQKGDSLVADLKLKQVTIDNVQGQGNSTLFEGKKLF
jgi:lipopolysaccharide assembly outer membrane protein LptD (OstA)